MKYMLISFSFIFTLHFIFIFLTRFGFIPFIANTKSRLELWMKQIQQFLYYLIEMSLH